MARRRSAVEEEVELNMTPMIDVTFQLLIFFIVTLKFKTLERKLQSHLPTDFGLNSSSEPIEEFFVTIKLRQPPGKPRPSGWRSPKRTKFYFETEEIAGTPEKALREIKKRLAKFRNDNKEAKGKIDAGLGVPHLHVVNVLDVFHGAKYEQVSFVGLAKNFSLIKSDTWFNNLRRELNQ